MVLEVPLLEGVEEVCLSVGLMEEEEEELTGPKVLAAGDHRPLSDSVWLALALTSVGFEDVVCTKVAVAPGGNNYSDICQTHKLLDICTPTQNTY